MLNNETNQNCIRDNTWMAAMTLNHDFNVDRLTPKLCLKTQKAYVSVYEKPENNLNYYYYYYYYWQ